MISTRTHHFARQLGTPLLVFLDFGSHHHPLPQAATSSAQDLVSAGTSTLPHPLTLAMQPVSTFILGRLQEQLGSPLSARPYIQT